LNGALFVKRSGTKKREWKAEIAAQKNEKTKILFYIVKLNEHKKNALCNAF
jgi:hypothetical protein